MRTSLAQRLLPACLVAIVTLTSGCVYGELSQVLRSQVAAETGCNAVKVTKRQEYAGAAEGEYQADACGEKRLYKCPTEGGLHSYEDNICTLEGTQSGPPGAPQPAADDAPADEPADDAVEEEEFEEEDEEELEDEEEDEEEEDELEDEEEDEEEEE